MTKVSKQWLLITSIIFCFGVLSWFAMGDVFTGNMEKGAKALSSAMFLSAVTISISISLLTMEHSDDDKKQSR